jgi:flavin reductase (DIM6/NTAB) family NADH-FMN oxidoreductase RutF
LKVELGPKNCLYPLPTVLVGAKVNGKPNYITIAHVGIMDPDAVSLGMNKLHYTNQGIKANKTFSINVPSVKQVKETDYCGLVSGKQQSKAELFHTFYGKLETAPMIEECALNMECNLIQTVDFPQHDIFIGKVVATHCDQSILTDGVVDLDKLQPILFAMNDRSYYGVGKKFANAWSVGKSLNISSG